MVFINKKYELENKYSSLANELQHIFCDNLGVSEDAWWKKRSNIGDDISEIESESFAYLICQRKGLKVNSDRHLSDHRVEIKKEMPAFGFYEVLQALTYIEEMGKDE